MSSYRRFVAYVYEYHGEQKKGNRGFVKVESRNGNCVIDVHLHCPNLAPEQECSVFGFVRKNQDLHGIELGKCKTAPGKVECRLSTRADSLNGQPVRLDDLGGMVFMLDGGGFYGTQWDDAPISPMAFKLPKKIVKPEKPAEDTTPPIEEPEETEPPKTDAAAENIEVPATGEAEENIEGLQQKQRADEAEQKAEASKKISDEGAETEVAEDKAMKAAEADVFSETEPDPADAARDAGITMEDAVRPDDGGNMSSAQKLTEEKEGQEKQQQEGANPGEVKEKGEEPEATGSAEDSQEAAEPEKCVADPEGAKQEETAQTETLQEKSEREMAVQEESDILEEKAVSERTSPEEKVLEEDEPEEAIPEGSVSDRKTWKTLPEEAFMGESEPQKTVTERTMREEDAPEAEEAQYAQGEDLSGQFVRGESMPEEAALEMYAPEDPGQEEAIPGEAGRMQNQPETSTPVDAGARDFWPFEDGEIIECRKIEPRDFRFFQRRDWPLKNNRFLLHGFYQFGYLLLGKLRGTNQYVLGVPGVYEQQERFMANMFGFPHFKTSRLPEFAKVTGGKGGFWYRLVNTPNFHPGNRR